LGAGALLVPVVVSVSFVDILGFGRGFGIQDCEKQIRETD
jgi:hypothetical protein